MPNFIIDFLYNIGLYKNELCDYVLQDKQTCEMFLNDVDFMEKGYHKKAIKIDSNKVFKNSVMFEKGVDALVKALEKR